MNEKGYMPEEEFKNTAEIVDELKDELPKVKELSGLIYDYIQNNPIDDFTESVDGYFKVTKIETCKYSHLTYWFTDFSTETVSILLMSPEILKEYLLTFNRQIQTQLYNELWHDYSFPREICRSPKIQNPSCLISSFSMMIHLTK